MVSSHWLLGLLTAVMAVHALVVYRAYRHRTTERSSNPAPERSESDLIDVEDGVVECPQCGTTNESGYRYCRYCVTQLPTTVEFDRTSDSPMGRVMR